MAELTEIGPAFLELAHRIVWCTVATVDAAGRPRSRILHPVWEFDGTRVTGWIATGPTATKLANLKASPFVSCNYWTPQQDTCVAECAASWVTDDAGKAAVWDRLKNAPAPVGYDPAMIPGWESSESPGFAGLKLEPWRLRVMPGSAMLDGQGTLVWQQKT